MLVETNEALVGRLRLEYTTKLERSGSAPGSAYRQPGPVHSHYRCTWAQDTKAKKFYLRTDYFSHAQVLDRSELVVVGGPSMRRGSRKAGEDWAFTEKSEWAWSWRKGDPGAGLINMGADFVRLGSRPFEGDHPLSQLLEPKYSSVAENPQLLGGRTCEVVDVQRPLEPKYFARLWIDKERAIPLRLEYYADSPTMSSNRMAVVDSINPYQLSNGGWIPVAGKRTLYFADGSTATDVIEVETATIRTKAEEIFAGLLNPP